MTLTKEYITYLYIRLKRKAKKCLERGRFDSCLKYLKAACRTAYSFYLGFTDNEIEGMLRRIGGAIRKRDCQTFEPRCVFYDTFSQDAQGLTMQYVDAIIAAGWEFLYITEFCLDDPRSVRLKSTLDSYSLAKVVTVPSSVKGMAKVEFVYDAIMDYAPNRLFMHISPSAVEAVVAFYGLPRGITKYQINLTDQTYWVGAGCVDYSFEFREYGASLSVGRRGVPKDRVLFMPYYPMMKETVFNGFPKETDGKVKIFSGASFYKIIDENDTFFKLNKAILDANPNAVTIFAGGGDMRMLNDLITKYNLDGRFIPIGQRNDIFECYKHCDIYLSSFPLGGGLMAQFAAHAGLPILALAKCETSGRIEEMVCQKRQERITFDDMDSLVSEASHLIRDEEYRKSRGLAMKGCVINIEEFNQNFKECVTKGVGPYPINIEENVKPHYLSIDDRLKLENKTKDYHRSVFSTLGLNGLFCCPLVSIEGGIARIKTSGLYRLLCK